MKIVVKYLNQKFLSALLFSFGLFTLILLIDQIFQLVNLALARGVSVVLILRMFFLSLPGVFSLSIPMAALLSVLILFGEINSNNELNILRGAGLNHWQIVRPVLALLIVLFGLAVLINHSVLPRSYRQFRSYYLQILKEQPLIQLNPRSITRLPDYSIYPTDIDQKNNCLKGLIIYKSAANTLPVRIVAETARIFSRQNRIFFDLSNGYWLKFNPERPEDLVVLNFEHYRLSITLPTVFGEINDLRQLTSAELLRKAKNSGAGEKNIWLSEYYLRWGLALAVVFLSLVGLPLAIRLEKGSRGINFGVSLGIIFGYYLLLILAINLSERNFWPAAMVMVGPNLVMGIIGGWFWKGFLKR